MPKTYYFIAELIILIIVERPGRISPGRCTFDCLPHVVYIKNMINTSLCYIENNGRWLMLHRVKKKQDLNKGKWVGVGGKFENGETPEQCCKREAREETGFEITELNYRGIVDFVSNEWPEELMHLFTAKYNGSDAESLPECSEGVLEWVPIEKVNELALWEGDRIFLEIIKKETPFFKLRLEYNGDALIDNSIEYI